jgi:AcrR family transcriptional regulator
MVKKQGSAASFDKDQTMQLIEKAALDLLAEQGILAGLNLREVADRARVNRGLVYHYFGTRRELLRSCLRRTFSDVTDRLHTPTTPLPPLGTLARDFFHDALTYKERWRTTSLLLLDDDQSLKVMPFNTHGQKRFAEAIADGRISSEADARECYALIWSAVYGYSILREAIARDLKLQPATMDKRMESLIEKLFATLDTPARDS